MEDSMNYIEEEDFIWKDVKRPKSRHLKLYTVTWNTNGKPPPPDLNQLFVYTADIYAIGLQETGSGDWIQALDSALAREDVVRIKNRRLQGIFLIVYVQRYLLDYVTHVESEITKTGFGGMWGNKGGVSIRFDIYGVNVVIVNCHLAAHQENVGQRVQDVNQILDTQKFRDIDVDNILDHDYVFWMGDLNFRVDKRTYESALTLLEQNNSEALLRTDQLLNLMKEGLLFPGFKESPIHFQPTYKFDVGTDIYDTSSKKRIPSFCDRVLHYHHNVTYGKKDNLNINVADYRSHPYFKDSDHKPVSCTLDLVGLSRPPINPISLKIQKTVSRTSNIRVAYTSNGMELNSNDWIGLYHANFVDFNNFISFHHVVVYMSSNPFFGVVNFNPISEDIPKGAKLLFCYFSKRNSISGISRIFTVCD